MNRSTCIIGCILIGAGIMFVGCQEMPVTGLESTTQFESSDFGAEQPQFRFRFTGRDSFGVSLRGKLSGSVEQPNAEECHALTGGGQISHLGKTTISEHTACIDDNEVTGTFTYEGRSGGLLQGSYEGTLANNTFEADLTIETADVAAVQEQPVETAPGKGTLTGTLTETHFRYSIEGWLFHHTRKQRVGVIK